MLFGDKKLFGVQAEIDKDYGGAWLFGRFCYWVNGVQVGNYELGTSLRDVFFNLKWIVHDCGNRYSEELCERPAEGVFRLLDASLYGDEPVISPNLVPDVPARFDIRPPLDVFDSCKIYLIECGDTDMILFWDATDSRAINVFRTTSNLFDSVINQVYRYLEELYKKEVT